MHPFSSYCCSEWALVCACVYHISDRVDDVCAGKQCEAAKVGRRRGVTAVWEEAVGAPLQFVLFR